MQIERTDKYSKKKQNAPPQGESIFRRGMGANQKRLGLGNT